MATLELYGSARCPYTQELREWLEWTRRDFKEYDVDADPEAAHLRKPEYPLEFVRTNRDAYITLSRLIPGMTILAPSSAEETSLKIKESISKVGLRTDSEHLDFPTPCSAGPREADTPIA